MDGGRGYSRGHTSIRFTGPTATKCLHSRPFLPVLKVRHRPSLIPRAKWSRGLNCWHKASGGVLRLTLAEHPAVQHRLEEVVNDLNAIRGGSITGRLGGKRVTRGFLGNSVVHASLQLRSVYLATRNEGTVSGEIV